MNAPLRLLPRFASAEQAIESLQPDVPLYLLHPGRYVTAAKRFLEGFPGDALYAVKANPAPRRWTRSGRRAFAISIPRPWVRSS